MSLRVNIVDNVVLTWPGHKRKIDQIAKMSAIYDMATHHLQRDPIRFRIRFEVEINQLNPVPYIVNSTIHKEPRRITVRS